MRSLLLGCLSAAVASAAVAATSEIPYDPDLQGQTVRCDDFRHDPDGAWTTLRSVRVQRQNQFTTVAANTSFRAGGPKTAGIDVGAMLDAVCRR